MGRFSVTYTLRFGATSNKRKPPSILSDVPSYVRPAPADAVVPVRFSLSYLSQI